MADKLSPDSILSKIFGRPISLRQLFLEMAIKRFRSSWAEQDRDERKRRLHLLFEMVREKDRILKTTNHATAFCDWAIEAIITGDKDDLRTAREALSFNDEDDSAYQAKYDPIFERFRQICDDALLTWPTENSAKA